MLWLERQGSGLRSSRAVSSGRRRKQPSGGGAAVWIEPPAAVAPEQLSVEPDTPHRSVAPARPLLPRPHRHHPLNDVPIEHTDTLNVLARHQLLPVATLAALQERHSR